jgi:hypothetical protein
MWLCNNKREKTLRKKVKTKNRAIFNYFFINRFLKQFKFTTFTLQIINEDKSMRTDKLDSPPKFDQTFAVLRDATQRRRANIQKVKSALLIWLDDNNIDNNSKEYQNTIIQLRRAIY